MLSLRARLVTACTRRSYGSIAFCQRQTFATSKPSPKPSRSSSSVVIPKSGTAQAAKSEAHAMDSSSFKDEIISFLYNNKQRPIPTGKSNVILTNCPHCLGVRKKSFAAYVDLHDGSYKCKTCSASGSWRQFSKALIKSVREGSANGNYALYSTADMLNGKPTPKYSRPVEEIEQYPDRLFQETAIVEDLQSRFKLKEGTLRLYKVGLGRYTDPNEYLKAAQEGADTMEHLEKPCLTFPQTTLTYSGTENKKGSAQYEFKVETVRIKACAIANPNDVLLFDPPAANEAGSAGLFGYHTAPSEADTVIITRRELDAMAAYEATGIPSFSIPTPNYQLQESVLPLLGRFLRIYLWLDDDVDGQLAADRFAQRLGIGRCLLVRTRQGDRKGPKSALEAWLQGKDLKQILKTAKKLRHDEILDFHDLREEVYREILNPEQTQGVQSKDIPALNKILKGHRPGELTILTGPTGIGKTTIISQLSLDYCKSGVPTLWGSFEIMNKRLAKKMLCQFAGKDLSECPREFDAWADKFEQLPLYFLKFFSSTSIRDVLKACHHAVQAYDVRHIILDNLQFMLSQQGRSHLDRWELQDDAVAELRKFATQQDVHVSLVVHPRKDPGDVLDINSVFGSAKVTQEADNVIIIQKGDNIGGTRYLDVKKNRFDGTLGSIPYKFNDKSLKIRPFTADELSDLQAEIEREASTMRRPSYNTVARRK